MQTATDTVRDLTEFVMYLCGLGVALFLLIMVLALIAYPFVMAYAAHLDDKEARARFNELAKESDERMRKVRADMTESEARFRKLTGQA